MKALIFDTETTDLVGHELMDDSHQPRIIEFFGHIVDDEGTVHAELEFLCNPGINLQKIITDITGLKDSDLTDAKPFSAHAAAVADLIQSADAVVAHNLAFDYRMVELEMRRIGVQVQWPIIRICTVQETEWLKGRRMKESDLYEYLFGEPFTGAHRAKADVLALTRIYHELRKRNII